MKIIFLTTILAGFIVTRCYSQSESMNWYFGVKLGMNFGTDPPTLVKSDKIWQLEGSTSISDSTGNLMFYSDGIEAWDRNHNRLPNGTGLLGEESSTQSALLLPKPGNSDVYYLFTTDAGLYVDNNIEGLRYSVINLCQNTGLGDILPGTKNTLLVKPTAEKLNAIYHANGTDIWVATHGIGDDKFYAYLLSQDGVDHQPVITSTGIHYSTDLDGNVLGQMKFSPDGKKVAMVKLYQYQAIVYDFDNSTGVVSNPIVLAISFPYGVEFSDDATKLYVSYYDHRKLGQFDLSAGNRDAIQNSFVEVPTVNTHLWAQLQLASNGRIYTNNCSVISQPNKKGLNASLEISNIDFAALGAGPQLGLPNFNQSYFDPNPYILYSKNCNESEFSFRLHHRDSVQSAHWTFGDPSSGVLNTSDQLYPQHRFSSEGLYDVTAELVLKSGRTIVKRKKVISEDFDVDLGADSVLCDAPALNLNVAQEEPSCYLWNDGTTNAHNQASNTGWYWVDVRQKGCTKRDSIYLQFETTPDPDLGADKILCEHETITLDSKVSNGQVIWSSGATSAEIEITEPGQYWVEGYNSECKARDTVEVDLQLKPALQMFDTVLCENTSLLLNFNEPGVSYKLNGKTLIPGPMTITKSGSYRFSASLNGCSLTDTLNVDYIQNPSENFYDSLVCEDVPVTLFAPYHLPATEFLWSTGSTDSSEVVSGSGVFTVQLTNHCFEESIKFNVDREGCPCDIFVPNIITANGDDKNALFHPVTHQRITDYDFVILNRWGKEVFRTSPNLKVWDGKSGKKELPSAVYYWDLKYSCLVGEEKKAMQKTGWVHLLK
jgi:gliding motility-associated-like protein